MGLRKRLQPILLPSQALETTGVATSGDSTASSYINGYVSNLRVVKGTAVYTGNFTPSTTPLTAISGTSLLTCQSAAFTDNSTNNFVITQFGNTTVTGNNPFQAGYYSNYFDGSTGHLTAASNAAFAFGTGDFTIECWVYVANTSSQMIFVDLRGASSTTTAPLIYMTSSGVVNYYTNGSVQITGTGITANTWNHLAVARSGTSTKLFINGTQAGSTYSDSNNYVQSSVYIARASDTAGSYVNGYMSNVRLVKGTAVYTAAFTPPTSPLTAITNTSLLSCQSARFIDTSANAFTITPTGSPTVQSFDPFYTSTIASNGGSMYFDGTGDYLSSPSSPAFALGTANYTVDFFIYTSSTTSQMVFDTIQPGISGGGSNRFFVYINTSQQVVVGPGTNTLTSSSSIQLRAWNHVAVVRSGTTRTIYINGVSAGSSTQSEDLSSSYATIGFDAAASGSIIMNGYLSNLRVTKGTALYTAAFTPPTSPPNPTSATSYLANGMNAGAYDATAINDLETVGDAKVQYFLGNYYAGSFDGTGDYLSTSTSSAIALGTSDFTLECWVYPSAFPNDATLVYVGTTSTGNEITLQIRNGQVASHLYVSGSHSDVQFTDLAPQLNTWSHLAISRASGVLYGFLNGVRSSVTQSLTANFGTSALAGVANGDRYAGSISNVRITKNAAIYSTATYTVPTSPLAATSNTAFLTCQNTTFTDNSPNALAITAYGNATAGATGPFTYTRGNSVYFDGSGDNLFLPSSPTMNFASGNWTIEGWVLVTTRTTNYPLIFGNNRGSFTTDALAITASNSDNVSYNNKFVIAWGSAGWSSPSAGNSQLLVSSVANVTGSWYHLAIVRNGTSVKMYRDGTEVASATVSAGATFNWGFNGTLMGGGNWDGAQGAFNGYLNNMRITPGIARYTANFTPPAQPFPPY